MRAPNSKLSECCGAGRGVCDSWSQGQEAFHEMRRQILIRQKILKRIFFDFRCGTMKEVKIYAGTCTGICDHTEEAVKQAYKWEPDYVAAQGGSTDSGAHYMGPNYVPSTGDSRIKRQFEVYVGMASDFNVPFCLGAGGMSGTNLRVEHDLRLLNEVAKEKKLKLRIAVISGEIGKEYLKEKLRKGLKIRRLERSNVISENLSPADVDICTKIVAQMGPEPMIEALRMDVDGVITGRSLDLAHHMALPLIRGFDKGLTAHLAKVIECGAMCAHPSIIRPVLASLREDHFLVTPADPEQKCTVMSVADHVFYERPNPKREENPGGILDLENAKYVQQDERTVKGIGGKWLSEPYTIKLEGAKIAGYETMAIMGVRDPNLIKQIEGVLERVKMRVHKRFADLKGQYQLFFHIYGKNGVLGEIETETRASHELCLLLEVLAETQDDAHSICAYADHQFNDMDFPGHLRQRNYAAPTAGRKDCGPLYVFNIWHLLPLEDPCEPFPIYIMDFPTDRIEFPPRKDAKNAA